MREPAIVSNIKKILKEFYVVVDKFGADSLNCPMREDDNCLAHTITTHCNILDCPIEDIEIDWEGIEKDADS